MTERIFLVFLMLLATSCQFFETEKVSSEAIYEDEMETINWKDVDRYPSFPVCENEIDKALQKNCFINTISSRLYQNISEKNIIAVREIYDTVKVKFEVGSSGRLSIMDIEMDSLLQKEFPDLESWILNSLDSLQPVAPAYKRGIPVKTQFTLPVIVQTN
ncbi:hypothetical protein EI546_13220 [Aequorivita sp. H23M31]|uniref:TonB C-terminal domain-containing protein n=1 Tax=Aequorivita ciconiae TaxID=2494375 RepID=A0A410G5S9_9FLAO|nr:hypothetical protein [Aequorivita sp. H23M31]QAA82619.1 hypothetical protein EI546_13220 [Aequorivita sp. H23M31]